MTHYMADSISRLESRGSEETPVEDDAAVLAVLANMDRGLEAAN